MKAIYWKGKIYEVQELCYVNDNSEDLPKYPSIPCPSPHPFTDGMEVTGMYEVKEDTWCDDDGYGKLVGGRELVAVPLTKTNKG